MDAYTATVGGDFVTDFLRGQRDCKDGNPHLAFQSEAYDRGYAAQYEWEQVKTAIAIGGLD